MTLARHWSIEYESREDADSIFVPAELLPEAQPGDVVQMTSARPAVTRSGRVIELVTDRVRGVFVTVKLDPPT
jgi:hypothetical protein